MTKILNLDEIVPEEGFAIKIKGETYELEIASIDTFVANTRAMKALPLRPDPEDEIEMVIGMILRAFPKLTRQVLGGITLPQLKAINDFARTAGGEKVETAVPANESAEGNAPEAS